MAASCIAADRRVHQQQSIVVSILVMPEWLTGREDVDHER